MHMAGNIWTKFMKTRLALAVDTRVVVVVGAVTVVAVVDEAAIVEATEAIVEVEEDAVDVVDTSFPQASFIDSYSPQLYVRHTHMYRIAHTRKLYVDSPCFVYIE